MIEELHRWASWLGFVLGATYFVTASVLFAPLRVMLARRSAFLRALVYCPACAATWVGLLTWSTLRWPAALDPAWSGLWDPLCAVFTAMALGLVWGSAIKFCSGDVYAREIELIWPERKAPSADEETP